MTWSVTVTETAYEDIRSAALDLVNGGSARAALRFLDTVDATIEILGQFPRLASPVRDPLLADRGYRWVRLESYLGFITLDEENHGVIIERVLYGRRDWVRLLEDDRG